MVWIVAVLVAVDAGLTTAIILRGGAEANELLAPLFNTSLHWVLLFATVRVAVMGLGLWLAKILDATLVITFGVALVLTIPPVVSNALTLVGGV
jgi:hypothetical protein